MQTFEYISLLSTIIWIILPLFRLKRSYFLFFSILAANDLSGKLLFGFFSAGVTAMWIPIHYLLLFSLDEKFFSKYRLPILLGFLPFVLLGYFATNEERRLFITIIHSLALLWFLKDLIREIILKNVIDAFSLIMVFYESVMVFKLIAMLNGVKLGMEVFYVGTAIQIAIGLYLIIVRKDIKISLGKEDISLEP